MALPKHIFYLLSFLTLTLFSCENEDDLEQEENENAISVEGFVYANEPVEYIKLLKIEDNGSSEGLAIKTADVSISQGISEILFFPADTIPGRYHQLDTTQTVSGESDLILHIMNEGMAYALPAHIPPALNGLSISTQNITLTPNHLDSVMATISWDNIEGYSYCIFIRNMGYGSFPVNYLDGQTIKSGAFFSLHHENEINLKCSDFTHYGNYELYVTAVNNDYANFYSNPMAQPVVENSAGEAPSWGIFTAFNGSTVNIQVN